MSRRNSLSFDHTLIELPLVMTGVEGHVVEFYGRTNDDGTCALIMLAGQESHTPEKHLVQGPFQSREHLLGVVKGVCGQFIVRGYTVVSTPRLLWELHAQRINNQKQIVRRENAGDFSFKIEDVFFDKRDQ